MTQTTDRLQSLMAEIDEQMKAITNGAAVETLIDDKADFIAKQAEVIGLMKAEADERADSAENLKRANALLTIDVEHYRNESEQYHRWWTEEQRTTRHLKKAVAELTALVTA